MTSSPCYPTILLFPKVPRLYKHSPTGFYSDQLHRWTKSRTKHGTKKSHPIACSTGYGRILRHHLNTGNLDEAKELYIEKMTRPSSAGVVLESKMVDAFMKSGRVDDAFWVFDQMTERNVVTWTSMISGCCRNPRFLHTAVNLFVEMISIGVHLNDFACNAALGVGSSLRNLQFGEQIHSLILRLGFDCYVRTACCLIGFYVKCGSFDAAELVFDRMVEPDLVAYTTMITGLCNEGRFDEAVGMFGRLMMVDDIRPNEHTLGSVLKSCELEVGKQIHGYMIKSKDFSDGDVFAGTALLELYSRNNMIENAKLIFSKLAVKNVVTWTSMIACYHRNNNSDAAVSVFLQMLDSEVNPNEFTFAVIIAACGSHSNLTTVATQILTLIIKLDLFTSDEKNRISNAFLATFSRSGEIESMEKIFSRITSPDTVSWTSMISGYSQNNLDADAVSLFRRMIEKDQTSLIASDYALSAVLSSSANVTSLTQGRHLHCLALKIGSSRHVCVGNALINMYTKSGSINAAIDIFRDMSSHDLTSWNSLIHGYASLGMGMEALRTFDQMHPTVPDESTFVSVLFACAHMSESEALNRFDSMRTVYSIEPGPIHYTCLVDAMGRAGKLEEAMEIIQRMPFDPDLLIWKSLLGSCKLHGNIELGKVVAGKVSELAPMDSAGYVLLSNMHKQRGEWEEADEARKVMDRRYVRKVAAQSWIEIGNVIHGFLAGDRSHRRSPDIYRTLKQLSIGIKDDR